MGLLQCTMLTRNKMTSQVDTESLIYHEKQVKELCAIHAINNLLQERAFIQKDVDKICNELSPSTFFNPHRSMFGTGNYDVNVIMAAMQLKEREIIWFDKRREVVELNLENIEGFILNIPSDYKLGGFIPFNFNRKHWITMRKVGEHYYNLDSKLKSPVLLGSENDAVLYLQKQLLEMDRELLLVVTPQVQQSGSWKLQKSNGMTETTLKQ